MLSDPNLMAMYNMEMPRMMPPMTSGSAMTNGIGSCGTPLLISKGNISARRIESEEDHSVEKNAPVYGVKSSNDARCNLKNQKDVVTTPRPPHTAPSFKTESNNLHLHLHFTSLNILMI